MTWAYVDTSSLVAVALDEANARQISGYFRRADRLFSANLLEAEFRATMLREDVDSELSEYLSWFSWVSPNRPLTPEIRVVLDEGYLRGADLWHLACALFLAGDASELQFLTCDLRQREVARALGFLLPE